MGKGLGSAAAASGSQLRKVSAQNLELLRERALLVEQKDRLQAVQRYCGGPWKRKKRRLGGR